MFKLLVAFLLIAAVHPAHAKGIDFTIQIVDVDGKAFEECVTEECKVKRPLTLSSVAVKALSSPEQNTPADQVVIRGTLALKVYNSKDANITSEEISLIKAQIAKYFNPIIVVRAYSILDPK